MKREFSYVELTYLVKEWQEWIGARISRIIMADSQLSFELYKTGGNKTNLNVLLPMAWIGDYKPAAPLVVSSFAAQLRKLVEGCKIKDVTLVKGERIIVINCGEHEIIFQLYGKGNLIVTKDKLIVAVLYKGKEIFPHSPLEIKEKADPALQKSSEELTAIIGKIYAKEVLLRKIPVKKLIEQKTNPCVVIQNGVIINITPFPLKQYEKHECRRHDTYNEAINSVMKQRTKLILQERVSKSFDEKITRLKNIITAQEVHLDKQKKEVQTNQEAGELIYENYTAVKEVLDVLQKARKKYSWEEIREKLKNHKLIKDVDEKKGKIILDLSHS